LNPVYNLAGKHHWDEVFFEEFECP
jgi:hypothetical protein